MQSGRMRYNHDMKNLAKSRTLQGYEKNKMADREGFEPSVLLPVHTLSRRAHSTTLTPAR